MPDSSLHEDPASPEPSAVSSAAHVAGFLPSSPELIELVLEQLPEPMTMMLAVRAADGTAIDARPIYMNAAARAHLGPAHPGDDGLMSHLFPNMVTSGALDACLAVLDTGTPASGSFTWHDPASGIPRGYDYRIVRVGPDLLIWMHHDNSELLAALDELRQHEQRTTAILDSLDQGIVLQAADRRLLLANRVARQLGLAEGNRSRGPGVAAWRPANEDGTPVDLSDLPSATVLRTGEAQTGRLVGVQLDAGDPLEWFSVSAFPLFHPDETVPYAAVSTFDNVSERKRLESELERLALYDELTGMARRGLLADRLTGALAALERRPEAEGGVGIVLLDLDGFKRVNDDFGHAVGDQVLRLVAERIRDAVRNEDTIARLGGDEFVVLYQGISAEQLVESGRRVVEAIRVPLVLPGPADEGELIVHVGASFGCTLARREDTPSSFLARADRLMYEMKGEQAPDV